jgi:hypothetical protein
MLSSAGGLLLELHRLRLEVVEQVGIERIVIADAEDGRVTKPGAAPTGRPGSG